MKGIEKAYGTNLVIHVLKLEQVDSTERVGRGVTLLVIAAEALQQSAHATFIAEAALVVVVVGRAREANESVDTHSLTHTHHWAHDHIPFDIFHFVPVGVL